jgi:hypothetical protein
MTFYFYHIHNHQTGTDGTDGTDETDETDEIDVNDGYVFYALNQIFE